MRPLLLLAGIICIASYSYSQTLIYSEDFSNGFPSAYSQQTNASDGGWNVGTASSLQSQSFPIQDQGSGQLIATNDDDCGQGCDKSNDFLITDTIDLTAYSGSSVFLRFDNFYFDDSYNGAQEDATVEISTDGGGSWNVAMNVDLGIWSRESIDLSSYAGQEIQVGFRYDDDGGWVFGWAIDNILVEEPVDHDLIVDSLIAPSNHKISNGPISMDATIFNNGGQTVTSFDINYVVNGDTTTDNINNVSIDPLSNYTFTIPTGFLPPSTGDYNVKAFASNINGNPDQKPSNDNESANILVFDTSYQRKPLYEVLTSSTCGPCQPGNENFEDVMSNYPNEAVTVKFQQDFPGAGDPYATNESVDRRNFYGVTGIPAMEIDGGWDGNANAFTSSLHEEAAAKPAFVKIDAEYKVWPDSQQQIVEVCYEIKGYNEYSNKKLYASINENTTTQNVGSNGETEFYNVFKKWFPGSNSTITIKPDSTLEGCMSYSFNGDYRLPNNASDMIDHSVEHSVEEFTDLNVAMWVQDNQSLNVFQSTYASRIDTQSDYSVGPQAPEDTTSITYQAPSNSLDINLFPNPAKDDVSLSINSPHNANEVALAIYNLQGQKIDDLGVQSIQNNHHLTINCQDYDNGIYFVEIRSNGVAHYEKLIIQK